MAQRVVPAQKLTKLAERARTRVDRARLEVQTVGTSLSRKSG
jgi:hypothetical protein